MKGGWSTILEDNYSELAKLNARARHGWKNLVIIDLLSLMISLALLVYAFLTGQSILIFVILVIAMVVKLGILILWNPNII